MNKIRVSAVSYTNTKPFVYGLTHSDISSRIDLSLDIPSICANKLIEDKVDIGLVPVAALPQIPGYQIISDYCIGAIGAVNSVFIFSNKPIEEIEVLRLDTQSRTSNNLAKVLLKNYWKLNPVFEDRSKVFGANGQESLSEPPQAFVEIGDRTFGKHDQYPYVYDLADEWQKFTGLPFVFAVWAANKSISEDFIIAFNSALKFGLDHREEVITALPRYANFNLEDYLFHRIDFNLDDKKKEALRKFLELMEEL